MRVRRSYFTLHINLFDDPVLKKKPDDNDQAIEETLADEASVLAAKQAEMYAELERIKPLLPSVLETLSPREATTIELRYGLKNGKPMTLCELSEMLGVTRERIRQIEVIALRKLRKCCIM